MGLFSRPKPEESAPLTPAISQERLIALFKERGWHYFVDSDNDLGGTWDDDTYYFMLRGKDQEILHIQSMWHLSIPIERLEEVRAFIREWHRQKLWPKAYHASMTRARFAFSARTRSIGNTVQPTHS